jgi:hypothetical protein
VWKLREEESGVRGLADGQRHVTLLVPLKHGAAALVTANRPAVCGHDTLFNFDELTALLFVASYPYHESVYVS